MATYVGSTNHIIKAVTGNSAAALERAIQREQARRGIEISPLAIYFDSNRNQHVAWYKAEITLEKQLEESRDANS